MKEKLKVVLQNQPYFLLFLPGFFLLHGYNLYFGFFPLWIILVNFFGVLLLTMLIYFLSRAFFTQKSKRSVLTFFILLFVLFFRSLHDFLKAPGHSAFMGRYSFILPAILVLTFLFGLYLKRISKTHHLITFFNYLSIVILLFELILTIQSALFFEKKDSLLKIKEEYEIKVNEEVPDSLKPDIYFLVFDGMPNTKALKEINSSYNSQFDSILEQKSFKFQHNSLSNYNQTVFSISCTLNMQYIDPSSATFSHLQYLKALESIKNNKLIEFLTSQRYKIFQIQPLSFNNEDWQRASLFSNLISAHFFYETLPGCIYKDMKFQLDKVAFFKNRNKKNKIEQIKQKSTDLQYTIWETKQTSSYIKTPKFVYAHFMIPHEPYIYNSNGELLISHEQAYVNKDNELTKFYEQALYAQKVALDLIDYLMKRNKKKSVIILQGDHGFRSLFNNSNGMIYQNLNAIYLPNQKYSTSYSGMSPVNTFRFVLNRYFNTKLPFLKDSSIFIPYSAAVVK